MDKLKHWGIISSMNVNDMSLFYTTVDNNEVIEFKDENGSQKVVNSLTIWSSTSDLFIQVGDGNYVIYVPKNSSLNLDYLRLEKMTVMGNAGQSIRYVAMYF